MRAGMMSEVPSDLLRLLETGGYIHQITDVEGLDALAAKQIVPGYIGFAPTAPSLHVVHLVSIMMLRQLQRAGHKPIVVMGGGTGKIGYPSFKNEARKLLTGPTIGQNYSTVRRVKHERVVAGTGRSGQRHVECGRIHN